MTGHLGADLAAFVDGELDHGSRERVLRHLSRCVDCRTEVEAQRRFKSRLLGMGTPHPEPDLAARLRGLAGEPLRLPRPAAAGTLRGARRRLPRARVGGALAAGGVLGVLVLGAPADTPTRTPVDPTSDAFLVQHARSTAELPIPLPAGVTSAGLTR